MPSGIKTVKLERYVSEAFGLLDLLHHNIIIDFHHILLCLIINIIPASIPWAWQGLFSNNQKSLDSVLLQLVYMDCMEGMDEIKL